MTPQPESVHPQAEKMSLETKVNLSAGYMQACLDLHTVMTDLEVPMAIRSEVYLKMMGRAYQYPNENQ